MPDARLPTDKSDCKEPNKIAFEALVMKPVLHSFYANTGEQG